MINKVVNVTKVKSLVQSIPWCLGFPLSKIPYQYRPFVGRPYSRIKSNVRDFSNLPIDEQKELIFNNSIKSIETAFRIPFYRDLYTNNGVELADIKSFEDIFLLPIITKEMLKEADIESRSCECPGRYRTNTGGTSGNPLAFYITPRLISNEWAHMHTIWESLGFLQSDLKLVLSGRNLGSKSVSYDGLRHSYAVSAYKKFDDLKQDLNFVFSRRDVKYLHGYPSLIADFARNLSDNAPDMLATLRKSLKGVFLSSEYPAIPYRQVIEEIFEVPTISWYGHTERLVLAWEKNEQFVYEPFQTYGFTEAVRSEITGKWSLVSTSFHNHASPFIRYDTGDEVEPLIQEDGILRSFRITNGRIGDFVLDKNSHKISLTAMIFGRHHALFNIARFVQVRQLEVGLVTIVITPQKNFPKNFFFNDWFDTSSLDLDIDFEIVDQPVLSVFGKLVLKIP